MKRSKFSEAQVAFHPASGRRGRLPGLQPPSKPTDNAFAESCNGKVRAECQTTAWFLSLGDARSRREAFLNGKWRPELEYRLIKDLWAFTENRIAVQLPMNGKRVPYPTWPRGVDARPRGLGGHARDEPRVDRRAAFRLQIGPAGRSPFMVETNAWKGLQIGRMARRAVSGQDGGRGAGDLTQGPTRVATRPLSGKWPIRTARSMWSSIR